MRGALVGSQIAVVTSMSCFWLSVAVGCGGSAGTPDASGSTGASSDEMGAASQTMDAADLTSGPSMGESTGADQDTTGAGATTGVGDTGGATFEDFTSIYLVGAPSVSPQVFDSDVVELQSRPQRMAVLSDGDFVVFGEEQWFSPSSGELWGPALYRFSGVDGTLRWKDVAMPNQPNNMIAFLGVGEDDTITVAEGSDNSGGVQITRLAGDGSVEWESEDDLVADLGDELGVIAGGP